MIWLALALLAAEPALDATVCRAKQPSHCICLGLVTEGRDAGGIAQLAAWIGDNPGWVIKTIGRCNVKETA